MTIGRAPQPSVMIVCIDTISPYQKSYKGNVYTVTIQCELSKYEVIIPIPNSSYSTTTIFEQFIII